MEDWGSRGEGRSGYKGAAKSWKGTLVETCEVFGRCVARALLLLAGYLLSGFNTVLAAAFRGLNSDVWSPPSDGSQKNASECKDLTPQQGPSRDAVTSRLPAPTELACTQETLCIFWDLEATGLDVVEDEIIEIGGAALVFSGGVEWCDTKMRFRTYVASKRSIPTAVVQLTGISNALISAKGTSFKTAASKFEKWIESVKASHQSAAQNLWFIAHSGTRFDMPIFFSQEKREGTAAGSLFRSVGCTGVVDSYLLARRIGVEGSLKLGNIYYSLTERRMEGEHSALGDALALAEVMRHDPFLSEWKARPVAYSFRAYFFKNRWRWERRA